MPKKKLIVSYKKLTLEIQDQIRDKYPGDLINYAKKISMGNNAFFYAIDFDTEEISYLVKIEVDFDKTIDSAKMEKVLNAQEGHRESQRMFFRSGLSDKSEDV
ncbi:MAG: hypothetical protein U9R19_02375 [Bacteroidota bacterium]|nr:hypothetical protein [Bacteroidota bacterium]